MCSRHALARPLPARSTPAWTAQRGGLLLDLEAPPGGQREYVPEVGLGVLVRVWVVCCALAAAHWGQKGMQRGVERGRGWDEGAAGALLSMRAKNSNPSLMQQGLPAAT